MALKKHSFSSGCSLFLLCFLFVFTPHTVSSKTAARSKKQSSAKKTSRQLPSQFLHNHATQEKEWNILVYIAAQNNLWRFADINLSQMEKIGSNEKINIIVQLDQFMGDEIHRLVIHKNQRERVWTLSNVPQEEQHKNPQKYSSGTQENFEDFLEWGIKTFPAKKQCVVLWNHGSGWYDPPKWRKLSNSLNAVLNNTYGVTRTQEFEHPELGPKRGVAFNDQTGEYLTNQNLSDALENVRRRCLNGRRFDIVGMDACNMSMLEIAAQVEDDADYLVASQEVELGAGWNYTRTLRKVSQKNMSPLEFAKEIVEAYAREYEQIEYDEYTMSVVDLQEQAVETTRHETWHTQGFSSRLAQLKQTTHRLAKLLTALLNSTSSDNTRKAIREARKKSISFFDDSFIDLHHFLFELQISLKQKFKKEKSESILSVVRSVSKTAQHAMHCVCEVVPHFRSGEAFRGAPLPSRARGISIYFPRHIVSRGYKKTKFVLSDESWYQFLTEYLNR